MAEPKHAWLRGDDHEATKASFPELFFDLVFVFALIQLSGTLSSDFSIGAASTSLLFVFALWWVWIQTTWITNLLDAEKEPVRLLLFGMMFLGIVMAIALPRALTDMGLVFAIAYSAMQIARSLFATFAFRGTDGDSFRTFVRIDIWVVTASLIWIAGGIAESNWRVFLWSIALVVEYLGPVVRYWVPGAGSAPRETLDINGEHLAERCALFVIIALGETILTTGKTASTHIEAPGTVLVLCGAFIGTVLMWWIYFHDNQERVSDKAEHTQRPQKTAQHLFTYGHLPIVAGIILTAVGEDFALSAPHEEGSLKHGMALLGGPAVFLVGTAWMRSVAVGSIPYSHLAGIALLVAGSVLVATADNATLQIFATGVLSAVAVWETLSRRQSPARATAPSS